MMTNSLYRSFVIVAILLATRGDISAQTDTVHYSSIFNRYKPYRIFLPADYYGSEKRYPVIYFFHGNQGTEKLEMEGAQQLVNSNEVILVAWNGRSEPTDMRPYNVGYHSNIKYPFQFKDYFLEFVHHIDSTYRTINDRAHRALIGHSMGGFMSFYLAGKYPQMVGAAVSSMGSPEFFVGYPQNHTVYNTRYMFKNLYGVNVRFHNGTEGEELHNLNNEVNQGAKREYGLAYSYQAYEGGHGMTAAAFKDAFDFVVSSFHNPPSDPVRWHHADLYPDFEVWGYQIKSNLHQPGYIDLKGVTKGGMNIRTRKWQPDGPLIPGVEINVKTAPLYKPNRAYTFFDFNETDGTKKNSSIISDATGRINFSVNYQNHQVGLYEKNGPAEIVFIQHKVNGRDIFLDHKKECNLRLRLLNRGGIAADKIKITLSSSAEGIFIANPTITFEKLLAGEDIWLPADFKVTASNKPTTDGSPFKIRFNLSITDNKGNSWKDEFDAPVYYDVPEFTNIGIDDGDSEIYGSGNGDNIADPGETIMIYQDSHRTRLYYDDPYIDNERLYDELQPDKWGDGYALSSLIHISKDCPVGHKIRFLACYEIKEWKTIKRNVTWGTFTITIGKPENNQAPAILK
ncbi:MAG: alpha/beta fold hydrolase [Bacteroidetes bacterium]|nr:alpha/beta fold hydrolase [Bacteroidota bacterium]